MDIRHCDGIDLLNSLDDKSIDLILTDPPYIISHETGMNTLHDAIESGKNLTKTEEEWNKYLGENEAAKTTSGAMENYMKYGTIYGTKYSVKTNYGEWDEKFTMNTLEEFVKLYYTKLRMVGRVSSFSIFGSCHISKKSWRNTSSNSCVLLNGSKQIHNLSIPV